MRRQTGCRGHQWLLPAVLGMAALPGLAYAPSPAASSPIRPAAGVPYMPPIVISSPKPGKVVTSPLRVKGTADVFEAALEVEVRTAKGSVLVLHHVQATAGTGTRGSFSTVLRFKPGKAKAGFVEAFTLSPKDGSRMDIVKVAIKFGHS